MVLQRLVAALLVSRQLPPPWLRAPRGFNRNESFLGRFSGLLIPSVALLPWLFELLPDLRTFYRCPRTLLLRVGLFLLQLVYLLDELLDLVVLVVEHLLQLFLLRRKLSYLLVLFHHLLTEFCIRASIRFGLAARNRAPRQLLRELLNLAIELGDCGHVVHLCELGLCLRIRDLLVLLLHVSLVLCVLPVVLKLHVVQQLFLLCKLTFRFIELFLEHLGVCLQLCTLAFHRFDLLVEPELLLSALQLDQLHLGCLLFCRFLLVLHHSGDAQLLRLHLLLVSEKLGLCCLALTL